jgi:hypothetical protein
MARRAAKAGQHSQADSVLLHRKHKYTDVAETVNAFNDQVRQRAGLDTTADVPLLPARNGEPEPAALPAGRNNRRSSTKE